MKKHNQAKSFFFAYHQKRFAYENVCIATENNKTLTRIKQKKKQIENYLQLIFEDAAIDSLELDLVGKSKKHWNP